MIWLCEGLDFDGVIVSDEFGQYYTIWIRCYSKQNPLIFFSSSQYEKMSMLYVLNLFMENNNNDLLS